MNYEKEEQATIDAFLDINGRRKVLIELNDIKIETTRIQIPFWSIGTLNTQYKASQIGVYGTAKIEFITLEGERILKSDKLKFNFNFVYNDRLYQCTTNEIEAIEEGNEMNFTVISESDI